MQNFKRITRKNGTEYLIRNNRDRFFYPKEWSDFFINLKQKQKITFDCLLNTGARINELRNVKIGDIDFKNKRIILRITKVKAAKKEKNPRPRTIPISTKFSKRLKKYIKGKNNEDFIGILSTPAANIAMKKTLKKAKIKDFYMFSIHNIRKTLENWLLALNVDPVKISNHMGHDISTAIQHYTSADTFSYDERIQMRIVLDDLYQR
jgi:integrase